MNQDVRDAVSKLERRLAQWLTQSAFPLWAARGVDEAGGFHERLDCDAGPLAEPRRARVQPRQVYAFSWAPFFEWNGPYRERMAGGLEYFLARYRRSDGLFFTLADADGAPLDTRALLYDQAFALLGLAGAASAGGMPVDAIAEGRRLRRTIRQQFKGVGEGYEVTLPFSLPLLSNPHMHLLEAALAWMRIDADPSWERLADELVHLACSNFIHAGTLREFFDDDWQPVPGRQGRVVEPGHQFEWAWLLLQWNGGRDVRAKALRLIDFAETFGVHEGAAIDGVLEDGGVLEATARLWPQTERLKAAAAAARLTGESRYWSAAREAAATLLLYLATPVAGLWFDKRLPSGEFVFEPAPASSFYHIVTAVAELRMLVRDAGEDVSSSRGPQAISGAARES